MDNNRSEHHRRAKAVDEAYRAGDVAALRLALGNPANFPNYRQPPELGVGVHPLEYAIYWSPIAFIEQLIHLGADPNYGDHAGFPPLIAALSSGRRDSCKILKLLIDKGAEVEQRGLNDWTPLHYAVAQRDLEAVKLLLDHEASPAARTRIDDCTTPLEDAETIGFEEATELLRAALPKAGEA